MNSDEFIKKNLQDAKTTDDSQIQRIKLTQEFLLN